jgi:hypothetical protein
MATLLESLTTLLTAVLTAAVPILGKQLWDWLQEKMKASAQARLGEAAARTAGLIYDELVATAGGISAVEQAKQAAVATMAEQLHSTMAETVSKLGGTRADVEKVVRGELGKLLARAAG